MFRKNNYNIKLKDMLGYFLRFLFLIVILVLFSLSADNQIKEDVDGYFPPMLKIENQLYITAGHTLKNVDEEKLVQIGVVRGEVLNGIPEENYQANIVRKGTPIYIYNSAEAYENLFLLEGDILILNGEQYVIYQTTENLESKKQKRKVQPY